MARGVSTVLDVTVALLLVGAAVSTLTYGTPPPETGETTDAASVASRLATVTATVQGPGGRRAHDTLAGHLASATVVGARIESQRTSRSPYPEAVLNATRSVVDERTYVTATWRPYTDAPLSNTVTLGNEPPPNADVTASRMVVDSGIARPDDASSFASLSMDLARGYVRWRFPPERTKAALVDPRTAGSVEERYRTVADALGVDLDGTIADSDARRANELLSEALARQFESNLDRRYETPRTAAKNVRTDEVRIVVRRWEP